MKSAIKTLPKMRSMTKELACGSCSPRSLSLCALQKQGSDSPRFPGPHGTSVSAEKGIIAPRPENGPRLVWHRQLGTGYGAPVISKGKLFQFDRIDNLARLQCLDARTGDFLWKFTYPTNYKDYFGYNNGPRCCPVVAGDRVFIYGPEGMLHCVHVGDAPICSNT